MPFLVIRGTFHVVGYEPDGDSVRFQADDPGNWIKLDSISQELTGFRVNLNARGHAQLRFEAIDALETHYEGQHQPLRFAEAGRSRLLALLGIENVIFSSASGRVESADDGTPGYILSRSVERFNRPISFVFTGQPPKADGTEFRLLPDHLKKSINYQLLAEGLAFPTYYDGLFPDLRATMTAAVQQARNAPSGFWPHDRTNTGATVTTLDDITEDQVVMPKLFRRLVVYLENGGTLAGFKENLAKSKERLLILSTGHFTHFDTLVEVNDDNTVVKLTEPPENLVFMNS